MKRAESRTFAVNWITAECASFLGRSSIDAFSRIVLRLGKESAVAQVKTALADPGVGNPFTYIESKLDRQKAQRDVQHSPRTNGHPRAVGRVRKDN